MLEVHERGEQQPSINQHRRLLAIFIRTILQESSRSTTEEEEGAKELFRDEN